MHDWGDEQGILVGLDNLDAVVQVIRNAKDGTEASLVLQQGTVLPINYQIYSILWWHRIEKVLRSLSSWLYIMDNLRHIKVQTDQRI